MELLHHGFAFGGDALYGHRAHWRQWGDPAFETPDNHDERTFMQASFYAALAGKVPWVPTERHRLIVTMYGGIGKNLDRFSTFRLPGRPTGYEWEALSRPLIPGVPSMNCFRGNTRLQISPTGMRRCFFLSVYSRDLVRDGTSPFHRRWFYS